MGTSAEELEPKIPGCSAKENNIADAWEKELPDALKLFTKMNPPQALIPCVPFDLRARRPLDKMRRSNLV